MVHFPGLARTRLYIQRAVPRFCRGGFPHSDIPGSKPACGSPRLIAASHVLLRLLAPRHSPYALSSLTTKLTQLSPMNSTATDDIPPQCGGFPPRGRSSRACKLVAFHKSALLSSTAPLEHSRSMRLRQPPNLLGCRRNRFSSVSQAVLDANLRLAIPTLPYGRNRDLLMPVSIFKEPSPASSAGAWLLSALESGFLQPPASCLEPPEQQKTRRQAPGCAVSCRFAAQRRA